MLRSLVPYFALLALITSMGCAPAVAPLDGGSGQDSAQSVDANLPSDAALPDTAQVDTAVPDVALPDSLLPDTSLPDSALPDNAPPDTSVADMASPDTAVPDSAAPDTAAPDACVSEVTALELDLDSTGGFVGQGGTDYHLHAGSLDVYKPFTDAGTCSRSLTSDELERLLAAASVVDWAGLQASYRPPGNQFCCCDQFFYDLGTQVDVCNKGDVQSYATDWCDEARWSGLLPQALTDFLTVLAEIGEDVWTDC